MFMRILQSWIAHLRDTRGTTALTFAIAVPALLAVVGAGIDSLQLVRLKSKMQVIADNAAMAAAKEFSLPNSTPRTIEAAVKSYVDAETIAGSKVSSAVSSDKSKAEVAVQLSLAWKPAFSSFLGVSQMDISSQATAKLLSKSATVCVLSLRQTSTKGVYLTGQSSIMARSCGVFSNSDHASAMQLEGSSSIYAKVTCAAGGVNRSGGSTISPTEYTDCPVVPDPLAGRKAPDFVGCDYTKMALTSGVHTLTPGVYCKGLSISGTAKVSFEPGVYIIDGGKLSFADQSSATGTDVGFYLAGSNGVLLCTDDATLRLSGRESGEMAGLLFFKDQAGGGSHRINCSNAKELVGTIYLPSSVLEIDPNASVAADSAFTAIIVYELRMGNNPTLVLNSDYGSVDVPLPEGANIDATAVLTK
jgi:Flp pilus assembly protein TadG